MTLEEKDLLLKDICARLPYGVIVQIPENIFSGESKIDSKLDCILITEGNIAHFTDAYGYTIEVVKPYLRPLSSMTEEEFQDLKSYSGLIYDQLELQEFYDNSKCLEFYLSEIPSYVVILVFDWLNKNMFDYRELISMGLALEAPKGMYNT